MPSAWLWASGIFFVLGSLLLITLIIAAIFMIRTIQAISARISALSNRVETISHQVEELVVSAKEVTGRAKGVANTLGGIATSSAHKLELITTVLFALGAIGKLRRTLGGKKKG